MPVAERRDAPEEGSSMRISIIVGPNGVERVVSVGSGLQSTRESLIFFNTIWAEVRDFHCTVVRKLKRPDESPHKREATA